MFSSRIRLTALALAVTIAGCERSVPTANDDTGALPTAASANLKTARERDAMDRLARRLAKALADPAFRAALKAQLDHSPYVEHKLQLQSFLKHSDRKALKEVARLTETADSTVEAEADEAIPLEVYFPVDAHRAAWTGGDELLVASAREEHEAPVAYDVSGRRQVLSPDRPPAAPVLAIVPVETDFSADSESAPMICIDNCGGGGGGGLPPAPPTGLFMTYSHFVQDFEGWFKGDPEFEMHILGQSGTSDSLTDYQCAGQSASGSYRFDQNGLDWTGGVMLFSQAQLNNYRAAHPNQNFRIIALEDDDTGCVIKFDSDRFKTALTTLQTQYPNLSGAKDTTTSGLVKLVKRANALQKILRKAYSFITTQDDFIGNAIESVVVGQSYPGANWVIRGEKNATNGWIKLEMR
jgi:hypothetical protein